MDHSRRFLCYGAPVWLHGTACWEADCNSGGGNSEVELLNYQLCHDQKHCIVNFLYTDERHTEVLYQKQV